MNIAVENKALTKVIIHMNSANVLAGARFVGYKHSNKIVLYYKITVLLVKLLYSAHV